MVEEAKKPYKYCLVPTCKNTTITTPDKVFFPIPRKAKLRKQWCKNMKRNEVSALSCLYCCEDHFNIKEDTSNYVAHNIMKQQGKKITLRLKEGVLPHIFPCGECSMPQPAKGMGAIEIQRLAMENEALTESAYESRNVLEVGEPSETSDYELSNASSEIETRCRICLDTNAPIPVFHHSEGEEDIQVKFFQCFYQKIENVQGYPQFICEACDDVIDSTLKFLKKYKDTCDILHSIFIRTVVNENGTIIKCERDVDDGETFDKYEMISQENDDTSNEHENCSEKSNESCSIEREHSDKVPHIKQEHFYSEIEIDISGNDVYENDNIVNPEVKTVSANDLINDNKNPEFNQTSKMRRILVNSKRPRRKANLKKKPREILHININSISSEADNTITRNNVVANKNPNLKEAIRKVNHLLVKPIRGRKVLDLSVDDEEIERLRNSYKSPKPDKLNIYSKPIASNLEDFEAHVKKQKEDFEAQLNKYKSRPIKKLKAAKSDPRPIKKSKAAKSEPKKDANKLTARSSGLCHHCGVTYSKLADHISGHEKLYNCPHDGCGKNLAGKYKLKLHIKRTHEDRKYECDVCGGKYAMKRDLGLHIKAVHMKKMRKIRKISCEVCGRMYVTKQGKDEHMRSAHTGERPFICTICNKGFTSQKNLKDHERLHTGETPFKCPICDRGYPQKGNMLSHVKHNHRKKDIDSSVLNSLSSVVLKAMKD